MKHSLVPHHVPNFHPDFGFGNWYAPRDAAGKSLDGIVVANIDNLRRTLAADTAVRDILARTGRGPYDIYDCLCVGHSDFRYSVACGCHACKSIIIGRPVCEEESSITILAGREGWDFYCRACRSHLDGCTYRCS